MKYIYVSPFCDLELTFSLPGEQTMLMSGQLESEEYPNHKEVVSGQPPCPNKYP
jgi:hypothetical protein